MIIDTYKTAETIARQLRAAGFQVARDGSNLSSSQYVTASMHDADDEAIVEPYKIRVSDHDLPPSYGSADYDVGPHSLACSDWTRVVVRLCEMAGVAVPAATRGVITREANKAAEARRRAAEAAACFAPIAAALEARRTWVDAELERIGLSHLTGVQRKKARYAAGQRYDAQFSEACA
ncbi:hypothetical protein ACMT1E_04390 [Sphingomonas flavalba]|uniref:hypothetical protein n=1 Tax=Sphingomonas flavalba TaxID=2559804 RepID=UPI0039DF6794